MPMVSPSTPPCSLVMATSFQSAGKFLPQTPPLTGPLVGGTLCGMVEPTVRERVDAFWSSTLGVDVADLHTPAPTSTPIRRSANSGAASTSSASTMRSPSSPRPTTSTKWPPQSPSSTPNRPSRRPPGSVAGRRPALRLGPGRAQLPDRSRPAWPRSAAGRRINPRDAEALAALRGAVSSAEWTETGFTGQPAMLFGIFDGETMLAAANLTPGPRRGDRCRHRGAPRGARPRATR